MSARDLDAAGITDPRLRASYEHCRRLFASHGRTYYLATLLLPPAKRPHVHALYGLARYADELVDDLDSPDPAALVAWSKRILDDLAVGDSSDAVGRAAVHTARTWGIPTEIFEAFFSSMCMDIDRIEYATYDDLCEYTYGSAAVIGLQLVPILEPIDPAASGPAALLGEAFQLTNFIRDVAEDLRRGRIYLPMEDLDAHSVTRADLAAGLVTPQIRSLLAFEIGRTRELYARACPGIAMLHPTSRPCVATAYTLYGRILDEVERADYDVFSSRVSVALPRRLAVALPGLVSARRARVRHRDRG